MLQLHHSCDTDIHHYRQDLPEGQLCRYCFYSQADLVFFRSAAATRCTDQGEIWQGGADRSSAPPAKFHLGRLRVGVYGPQNFKKWNFSNIIAPKGRVPCTILTKFTGFYACPQST